MEHLSCDTASEISYVQTLSQKSRLNVFFRIRTTSNRRYCLEHGRPNVNDRRWSFNFLVPMCFEWAMWARLCSFWFIRPDNQLFVFWIGPNFGFSDGVLHDLLLTIATVVYFDLTLFKTWFKCLIYTQSFPLFLHLHQLSPQASELFLRSSLDQTWHRPSFKLADFFKLKKPTQQPMLLQHLLSNEKPKLPAGDNGNMCRRPYLGSQLVLEQLFFSLCLTKANFHYFSTITELLSPCCVLIGQLIAVGFHLPTAISCFLLIKRLFTPTNLILQLFWQTMNLYYTFVVCLFAMHIAFYFLCGMFLSRLRLDQLLSTATGICHSRNKVDRKLLWLFCHELTSCQQLVKDTGVKSDRTILTKIHNYNQLYLILTPISVGAVFSIYMGLAYFVLAITTCVLAFITFYHDLSSFVFQMASMALALVFYVVYSLIVLPAASLNLKVGSHFFLFVKLNIYSCIN